jgi:hypothetical protein
MTVKQTKLKFFQIMGRPLFKDNNKAQIFNPEILAHTVFCIYFCPCTLIFLMSLNDYKKHVENGQ